MPKTTADKAAEQEALVLEFMEESREILEDPESGVNSLCKVADVGKELLNSSAEVAVEATNRTKRAVYRLNAASDDPRCPLGTVRKREKTVKRLEAEHKKLAALYAELSSFMDEVVVRLRQLREELPQEEELPEIPELSHEQPSPVESSEPVEPPKKLPRWRSKVGGWNPFYSPSRDVAHHAHKSFSEAIDSVFSEARESPVTPSRAESDREDYEKLLAHYEEVLEVLEKLVATRQAHMVDYENDSDLAERWQETYKKLTDKLAWCDRNMDYLEQRNVPIAASELVSERQDLIARRAELEAGPVNG